MALINCSECEKQISDKAQNCPNCGYPVGSRIVEWEFENDISTDQYKSKTKEGGFSWRSFYWLLFVIVIVAIIALATCDDKNNNRPTDNISQLNYDSSEKNSLETKYPTASLNVREKPDGESKIIRTLTPNEKVTTNGVEKNGFIQVFVLGDKNLKGWCASKYLQNSPLTQSQLDDIKRNEIEAKQKRDNAWLYKDESTMAFVIAEDFVKKLLKSPRTAKFPWYDNSFVTRYSNQVYVVSCYVDSQNSFGAMLRTNFTVKVKQVSKDNWQLVEEIEFY